MISCLNFPAVISVMMIALCHGKLFGFHSCDKCNCDNFL